MRYHHQIALNAHQIEALNVGSKGWVRNQRKTHQMVDIWMEESEIKSEMEKQE
jgi:hypothetical protein